MRGQSNVIGVALLLGVTVVALSTLTASIGAVVEQNAASADATRVAADFDRALDPVTTTGTRRGRVSFTDGQLRTVGREIRLLNEAGVVRTVHVDALVFTAGENRVAFLAGAIVRGTDETARLYAPPPITASRSGVNGVLVVGAPKLGTDQLAVSTAGKRSVLLRSNVSHRRYALGNGTYRVAVETTTPAAWTDHFERQNATIESATDFDDDGVDSVVARYPGDRVAYLVVHEMELEVDDG